MTKEVIKIVAPFFTGTVRRAKVPVDWFLMEVAVGIPQQIHFLLAAGSFCSENDQTAKDINVLLMCNPSISHR